MQYPVPQFTDVEDKIIGPLTLKQFGILAMAGAVVFLIYSGTKNIPVTVVALLLFGLPALFIAFGKINGRPFYNFLNPFVKFLMAPKMLVFDKQGSAQPVMTKTQAQPDKLAPQDAKKDSVELKRINYVLQQQAQAQSKLIKDKLSN